MNELIKGILKRKNKQPETVYSTVQRERSRPFKEQLKEYREHLRNQPPPSKVSRGISKGFSLMQRGAVTRKLYRQPVAPYGSNINNLPPQGIRRTGRKGRPVGTVKYRDAQGNPIGVYEYRKLLSLKNWKERQGVMERSVTNPKQLAILRQIQQRDAMAQQSPEARVIPSTQGNVFMGNIMDEIDRATNLVD